MAEISNNHLGWCWNPINNRDFHYQPQLVNADFSHQRRDFDLQRSQVWNLTTIRTLERELDESYSCCGTLAAAGTLYRFGYPFRRDGPRKNGPWGEGSGWMKNKSWARLEFLERVPEAHASRFSLSDECILLFWWEVKCNLHVGSPALKGWW